MNNESIITIFFTAAFTNNIILMRYLGLCSFFGVSNKTSSAVGMSLAVTFVMFISTFVTWLFYYVILLPLEIIFLRTIVFILVIAALVQFIELYMKKNVPALFKAFGIYLPLITTNCAILAVTFLAIDNKFNLLQALVFSIGVAVGYTIAIILFSSIRERLEVAPIPESMKGYGIVFITASLMALTFMGFK